MRWHWRSPGIDRKLLPYKLFYLAIFSGGACLGPFLPVFFQGRGLTESQIGFLGFLRPIIGIFTAPLWTTLTDLWGFKKTVLLVTVLGSTLFRFLFMYPPSFATLIPLVVLANFFGGAPNVLADAFTMDVLKDKTEYGKQRLWGAVGWGLTAPICGAIVTATRIEAMFWLHALFMIVSALVATHFSFSRPNTQSNTKPTGSGFSGEDDLEQQADLHEEADSNKAGTERLLPASVQDQAGESSPSEPSERNGKELSERRRLQKMRDDTSKQRSIEAGRGAENSEETTAMLRADKRDQQQSLSSGQGTALKSDQDTSQAAKSPPESGLQALDKSSQEDSKPVTSLAAAFRKPSVVSFFLIMILMGIAMGTIDGFLPLRLTELGGNPTVIGLALTFTCIAEVPLMWVSGRLIKSLGVLGVLYLALACYVARFAYFSLLKEPWAVLPIELLHGVTFGCGWTAGTVHSGRIAPPGLEATMQALFSGAYFGIGTAAGMLGGGFVYEHFGSVALFRWAGLLTAIGGLIFALSQRWCPLEGQSDEHLSQPIQEEHAAFPLKKLSSDSEA